MNFESKSEKIAFDYAEIDKALFTPPSNEQGKDNSVMLTERRLYALAALEVRILDSREELAELENLGVDALRHHSLSVVSMLSPGMRIDPEEAHAMQMARLRARLAADEFEVRRMRRALDYLREDEYFPCIELYYFRRKGDAYIAEKLYRDISTVRRNRRRLVRELAGILYY